MTTKHTQQKPILIEQTHRDFLERITAIVNQYRIPTPKQAVNLSNKRENNRFTPTKKSSSAWKKGGIVSSVNKLLKPAFPIV